MDDKGKLVCKICGAPLQGKRRSYCSDACARDGANIMQRVKVRKERPKCPVYTERACQDCGVVMLLHIKSKRCPDCQREANLAADRECKRRQYRGQTRKIGSIDLCQNCGNPYTVNGGLQRYCKACAEWIYKKHDRETSRQVAAEKLSDAEYRDARNAKRRDAEFAQAVRTCPVCGKQFKPQYGIQKACSPECSKIMAAQNDKRYREQNADRLTAARKKRLAEKNKKESTSDEE